ncbi:hypothetical protein C8Q75DRAFT_749002 [Abortiporus biennis]|nr:hypothetical protein C8Q75DRAFT_749002 [Abortiporus biennis]
MDRRWCLFILCTLLVCTYAQNATDSASNDTNTPSYAFDPILQYRPSFACSLPIQILMTGIVLTLTSVLLIHLIFTGQYHWPLAPVNYALQLSAVFTLLISLIATLQVILATATRESRSWPYMLNYISVGVPPLTMTNNSGRTDSDDWSSGELAAWSLMNATTSALIQITHIQFLTLLFPSGLERRLIFTLLGPLAIVSAIMQLLPLHDPQDDKLISISSAVQNVCNATLSLIFTAALFIWGFLVNRRQAWRTDGGTAAFGAGALMLALASTAITFIYIPNKDQYVWMPPLMWAVILWQSFLGWWWWVGSGMGVGEVDELLRREEKRRRRRKEKLEKRKQRKEKTELFWRGVAGALGYESKQTKSQFNSPRMDQPSQPVTLVQSRISGSSSGTSTAPSGFLSRLVGNRAGRALYGWFLLLRHAHLTAAREQAVEHGERIQQVYGQETQDPSREPGVVGWGLGSYAIRQREAGGRREDLLDLEEEELELDSRCTSVSGSDEGEGDRQSVEGDVRRRRARQFSQGSDSEAIEMKPMGEDGAQQTTTSHQPSSMWWWGPLQRWRHQDTTVYS